MSSRWGSRPAILVALLLVARASTATAILPPCPVPRAIFDASELHECREVEGSLDAARAAGDRCAAAAAYLARRCYCRRVLDEGGATALAAELHLGACRRLDREGADGDGGHASGGEGEEEAGGERGGRAGGNVEAGRSAWADSVAPGGGTRVNPAGGPPGPLPSAWRKDLARPAGGAVDPRPSRAQDQGRARRARAGGRLRAWEGYSSLPTNTSRGAGSATPPPSDAIAPAAPVRLFVGVVTASYHRARRDAIRETWGSGPPPREGGGAADGSNSGGGEAGVPVRSAHTVHFFSAEPADPRLLRALWEEGAELGDLTVVAGVGEHYLNITHQTRAIVCAGARAANRAAAEADAAASEARGYLASLVRPRTFTHVMKTDDDAFVRLEDISQELERLPRERLFWGNLEKRGGRVERNRESQWYVSEEEWPEDSYPSWAHGAGYVFSSDLAVEVAGLLECSRDVEGEPGASPPHSRGPLFKLEDVAAGQWVREVELTSDRPVNFRSTSRVDYWGCRARDLLSHYVPAEAQRCLWRVGGICSRCARFEPGSKAAADRESAVMRVASTARVAG